MYLFESRLRSYTAQTLDVWVDLLKNYPLVETMQSINYWIHADDDFPTIAKIVSKIKTREDYRMDGMALYRETISMLKTMDTPIPSEGMDIYKKCNPENKDVYEIELSITKDFINEYERRNAGHFGLVTEKHPSDKNTLPEML